MDALLRKYRISKLNVTRLKDQMSDLSKVPTMSIKRVSKLEALLLDFRKQKDVFKSIAESILVELDNKATNTQSKLLRMKKIFILSVTFRRHTKEN